MVIFLLAPLKVARHKPQLRIILNYTNYPTIPHSYVAQNLLFTARTDKQKCLL
jgi:hypothetical protein